MTKLKQKEAEALRETYKVTVDGVEKWADAKKIFLVVVRNTIRRHFRSIHGYKHNEGIAAVELLLVAPLPEGDTASVNSLLQIDESGVWYSPTEESVSEPVSISILIPWHNIIRVKTIMSSEATL